MKKKIIEFISHNEFLRNKSLAFSIWLNNVSYTFIKAFAAKPGEKHPKHAIMNYHQFFVDNTEASDKVLDIGCGQGAVAYDVSSRAAKVVGVDIVEKNIKIAKEKYQRENLEFISGDCLIFDFSKLGVAKFDKIILSNVLEHIDGRVEFLQGLHKLSDTILLRVPLITRDWLAVFKRDNGFKYKLSTDHKIEYTEEILREELAAAGWKIEKYSVNFGEVWAVVVI